MSKLRLIALAVVLALAGLFAVTETATAERGPGGGTPGTVKVEGTLVGVNLLTGQVGIRVANGATVVVVVTNATKLERNGRPVPLAAFMVGDRAQAIATTAGVALKLEAVGP
jgi:hypothetical protein